MWVLLAELSLLRAVPRSAYSAVTEAVPKHVVVGLWLLVFGPFQPILGACDFGCLGLVVFRRFSWQSNPFYLNTFHCESLLIFACFVHFAAVKLL